MSSEIILREVTELTPETASPLLDICAEAKKRIKDIEALAYEFIKSGNKIPNWYLAEGNTRRSITDNSKVYKKLKDVLLSKEIQNECTTIAIGKLEELFAEKSGIEDKHKAKAEFYNRMKDLIETSQNKPTLTRIEKKEK